MSEVDYKERLRIQRENIIPKGQVILNSVFYQPKSISEIKSILATYGHSRNFSHKRLKTLFDRLDIVGIPTLCSLDKPGDKTSRTWKYGLRDKIMTDLEGAPDACEYINRTSWYLKQTLGDCFYNF
jgi:hypothetical protein